VAKVVGSVNEYDMSRVTGDAYAGMTFRTDFLERGIAYDVSRLSKSDIYEGLEPRLNAGEVELLDVAELQEQLLTLVWRGSRIDHLPGDHDDYANAAAGAVWLASRQAMDETLQVMPVIIGAGSGDWRDYARGDVGEVWTNPRFWNRPTLS
jgi:hypothetical protein